MANNIVDIKTIGSILDNKNYFYVPCYQRGYRWNRKQVEELLSDLYSFHKQYNANSLKAAGNFYCLQPIIVREITDDEVRASVLVDKVGNADYKLWELVDGQQRLTTIYILLSYLININKAYRGNKVEYVADYPNTGLYNIVYESRPSTCEALSALAQGENLKPCDLDATHISNAVRYIDEWFNGKGLDINKRYNGGNGESKKDVQKCLLNQIVNISEKGSTKVIWYQLSNDADIDPVQEFTRINNGKIPLTDTELIKALLLQKKNFETGDNVLEQTKISLQWEQMENTLQRDDFWCFISNKGVDEEDRMGELLKLGFLKDHDMNENEIEPGDIFRYYYEKIDGLPTNNLQKVVNELWTNITDTYNVLHDWYETPEIYNYVGYLVQTGMSLTTLYKQYENKKDEDKESTINDLIAWLEEDIKAVLPAHCVEKQENGKYRIITEYPDRPNLRKILLLLNVDMLSRQLREIRDNDEAYHGDANVFKFPFDLYKIQNWDIEHIDSATTNALTDKEAQRNWVEGNINDYGIVVTDAIRKKMMDGEWADLVEIIQRQEGEEQENKNVIGNLTLLDSSTNREYGNALFRKKRKYIIDKTMNGRYVLPCTQYVFMKFFDADDSSASKTRWTKEDKERYHDFIFQQLQRFLPIKP